MAHTENRQSQEPTPSGSWAGQEPPSPRDTQQETSLADPKHRNTAKISPSGSGRGRIWEDIGLCDIIGITFTAQPTLSLGDVLEQISWHFVAYLTGK